MWANPSKYKSLDSYILKYFTHKPHQQLKNQCCFVKHKNTRKHTHNHEQMAADTHLPLLDELVMINRGENHLQSEAAIWFPQRLQYTHFTLRVHSPWCLMEPSYGLLIGQTAARLIYSSNQALINSRTLVRPPLKVVVITHSMEKTSLSHVRSSSGWKENIGV